MRVGGITPTPSVYRDIIKVKRGHQGGALFPRDWCPYERRKRHQGCVRAQGRGHMGTWGNQTCWHFGLVASRSVGGNCPCCLLWQPEQTETPTLLRKPPNCGSLRPGPGWRPRPVLRPGTLLCLLYASSFYFFLSIKGSADPRASGPTLESRKSLGLLTRNLNF